MPTLHPATAHKLRVFNTLDAEGEPYQIGERSFGIVTPQGAIEFNRYARFSEPTGEAWRDEVATVERQTTALLSNVADVAVLVAIVLLMGAAGLLVLMIEAGL